MLAELGSRLVLTWLDGIFLSQCVRRVSGSPLAGVLHFQCLHSFSSLAWLQLLQHFQMGVGCW